VVVAVAVGVSTWADASFGREGGPRSVDVTSKAKAAARSK
jgi:hypothetical protein